MYPFFSSLQIVGYFFHSSTLNNPCNTPITLVKWSKITQKEYFMDREYTINLVSEKIKLIRTEADYTQDKMANILGISKKTLVQIEKGRITTGWTTCIAICALFRESSILQNALGGDPLDVIELLAHDIDIVPQEKTMGGHIWWRNVKKNEHYKLQQNILSQHYRIIDKEDYRLISSLDEDSILEFWNNLNKE